jgi:hypothetical protein
MGKRNKTKNNQLATKVMSDGETSDGTGGTEACKASQNSSENDNSGVPLATDSSGQNLPSASSGDLVQSNSPSRKKKCSGGEVGTTSLINPSEDYSGASGESSGQGSSQEVSEEAEGNSISGKPSKSSSKKRRRTISQLRATQGDENGSVSSESSDERKKKQKKRRNSMKLSGAAGGGTVGSDPVEPKSGKDTQTQRNSRKRVYEEYDPDRQDDWDGDPNENPFSVRSQFAFSDEENDSDDTETARLKRESRAVRARLHSMIAEKASKRAKGSDPRALSRKEWQYTSYHRNAPAVHVVTKGLVKRLKSLTYEDILAFKSEVDTVESCGSKVGSIINLIDPKFWKTIGYKLAAYRDPKRPLNKYLDVDDLDGWMEWSTKDLLYRLLKVFPKTANSRSALLNRVRAEPLLFSIHDN